MAKETKHTPGLTDAQVFGIAEKYGAFEFGDAQGAKRLAFAADVISAYERLRAAAPELLNALQTLVDRDLAYASGFVDRGLIRIQDVQAARAAIDKATGSAQ